MTTFTDGDVSASQTLSDLDHLYPEHVNELRVAVNAAEADIAGLSANPYGFTRQLLINGNMDIVQRVGPFTNPGNGGYFFDKWKHGYDAAGGTIPTVTLSQQELLPGELWGAQYYMRHAFSGAGSVNAGSYYTTYNTIPLIPKRLMGAGRYFTLSFMARSSLAGKRIGAGLGLFYGVSGSFDYIYGNNWTLTSDWQPCMVTFDSYDTSGKTYGTDDHNVMFPKLYLAWGSDVAPEVADTISEDFGGAGTVDITEVNFSQSAEYIPFFPRSFYQEYMESQYYYRKSYPYSVAPGTATESGAIESSGAGGASTIGNIMSAHVSFEHSMRVEGSPTPTIYDIAGTAGKVSARNADGTLTHGLTATVANNTSKGFKVSAAVTATTQRGIVFQYVQEIDV